MSEVVYYLKRKHKFDSLNTLVKSVIRSYKDNIFPFAYNLLDTVGRQRKFTHKMVVMICDYEKQNSSIKRCEDFMNLITKNPQKCIVPTLDIDLAWHTHMLNP